ncbi:hypothetical protein O6H91_Y312600 [Diphasiastrum complanatum]|nr:hypothetical protein O6H91_Y312600 [Diphasiastrum complanatum]
MALELIDSLDDRNFGPLMVVVERRSVVAREGGAQAAKTAAVRFFSNGGGILEVCACNRVEESSNHRRKRSGTLRVWRGPLVSLDGSMCWREVLEFISGGHGDTKRASIFS